MTSILTEQKRLLAEKIRVLERLGEGLQWSLERLPALNAENVHDPAVTERTAAIVERFRKLQDQLAGAMGHAHAMLGEKRRSFQDVVTWAVKQGILADHDAWLELRSLRNRLTHEYDLHGSVIPELLLLVRSATRVLVDATTRFVRVCNLQRLL